MATQAIHLINSTTLYGYVAELLDLLTQQDEEQDAEARAALEADIRDKATGTREKVDRTVHALRTLESQAALADQEIDRLSARSQAILARKARLEKYVMETMQATQIKRLEGATTVCCLRKNPAALVIDPGTAIPAEYIIREEKIDERVDNAAIKAALKAGEEINGARLIQRARLEIQ